MYIDMDEQFSLLEKNVCASSGNREATRGIQFAYHLNGTWYAPTFPISQAMYHKNHTGPYMCEDCYEYGFVNELFTQYCESCAKLYDNTEKRDLCETIKAKVANMKKEIVDLSKQSRKSVKTKNPKKSKKTDLSVCGRNARGCCVEGCGMNAVKGTNCYEHWEEYECEL